MIINKQMKRASPFLSNIRINTFVYTSWFSYKMKTLRITYRKILPLKIFRLKEIQKIFFEGRSLVNTPLWGAGARAGGGAGYRGLSPLMDRGIIRHPIMTYGRLLVSRYGDFVINNWMALMTFA